MTLSQSRWVSACFALSLLTSCGAPDVSAPHQSIDPGRAVSYPLTEQGVSLSANHWLLWHNPRTAEEIAQATKLSDLIQSYEDQSTALSAQLASVMASGCSTDQCQTCAGVIDAWIQGVPMTPICGAQPAGVPHPDPSPPATLLTDLYSQFQDRSVKAWQAEWSPGVPGANIDQARAKVSSVLSQIDAFWDQNAGPGSELYRYNSVMPEIIALKRQIKEVAINGSIATADLDSPTTDASGAVTHLGPVTYYQGSPSHISFSYQQSLLFTSADSSLEVSYSAGSVLFDGTSYSFTDGKLLLPPLVSQGEIFVHPTTHQIQVVDLGQEALPTGAIALARFVTGEKAVQKLTDARTGANPPLRELYVDIEEWGLNPADSSVTVSFTTRASGFLKGKRRVQKYVIENASYLPTDGTLSFDAVVYSDVPGKKSDEAADRRPIDRYAMTLQRVKNDRTQKQPPGQKLVYYTGQLRVSNVAPYDPSDPTRQPDGTLGEMSMDGLLQE